MTTPVLHLYVHVPFCAHRCGYCDFVTVTGHEDRHALYIDALRRELECERTILATPLETIFIGGGTPTLIGPELLDRLLDELPAAREITVEANPETVDDALAEVLARHGVRVSLGAQSFGARELAVLERRATPDTVRAAVVTLRRGGVSNLNLDVLFGIPGETRAALDRDIDEALALEPDHLSCYELEAKPGTRFTFRHGAELARQAELLEDHYEHVIERLEGPATAGTRPPTTVATIAAAGTTWRSGAARTTSASASEPSRRWASYVGATARASDRTSLRSSGARRRSASRTS